MNKNFLLCLVFACVVTATPVIVGNCTDQVHCSSSTCSVLLKATEGECVTLPSNNGITAGKSARFWRQSSVQICSPTQVFFNDPTCSKPLEELWTPCGTCLQFPPRLQTCGVVNGTFKVFVQSCTDAQCQQCGPIGNSGLPPKKCYAHPGVPGLYLMYANLEACEGILVHGYEKENCGGLRVSQTILPGQGKCFGGLNFS